MILHRRVFPMRRVLVGVFLLLGICSSSTALADPLKWEHWDEGLPAIALVLTLATDPEQPQNLYAGTYSLLDVDGTPKPAFGRLQETFATADFGQHRSVLLKILNWLSPDFNSSIVILARDEEVHLGDSE